MDSNLNLYTKTKQILNINEYNPTYNNILNENNEYSLSNNHRIIDYNIINKNKNENDNNNDNNFENYSNDNRIVLQKNNERIFNLNKSIKEDKSKISNFLSPMKFDIDKEKKEYKINTTLNQLINIKSIYNMNTIKLQNDMINMNNKKNKLLLVYNSLFHFKQNLLNKEKQIKEKENKINKFENNLKINENILKNNLQAFNNYINYQTLNLINKFKNINNYHQQKEDELKLREKKINEYEMIIKNIIKRKEENNKQKLIKCDNIGEEIEKKLEKEMEIIMLKEKENKMIKDRELLEKEKEQLIKEKELIQKEKEQIQVEKDKNKNINNKLSKQLKQKDFDFQNIQLYECEDDNNNNNDFKNRYKTPIREEGNENINLKNKSIENKSLTPMIFHSLKYKISHQYNKNRNKYKNNKNDSLFTNENIVNNISSRQTINDQFIPVKKINSYIHDNIYLLNNRNINNSLNLKSIKPNVRRHNSTYRPIKILTERGKNENFNYNYTNRTINVMNNISKNFIIDDTNDYTLNIKNKNQSLYDKTKSKYLETSTNDNNEAYNDINKKIFEVEKVLQIVKNQDKKIQIIKDKLDKKMKNSS